MATTTTTTTTTHGGASWHLHAVAALAYVLFFVYLFLGIMISPVLLDALDALERSVVHAVGVDAAAAHDGGALRATAHRAYVALLAASAPLGAFYTQFFVLVAFCFVHSWWSHRSLAHAVAQLAVTYATVMAYELLLPRLFGAYAFDNSMGTRLPLDVPESSLAPLLGGRGDRVPLVVPLGWYTWAYMASVIAATLCGGRGAASASSTLARATPPSWLRAWARLMFYCTLTALCATAADVQVDPIMSSCGGHARWLVRSIDALDDDAKASADWHWFHCNADGDGDDAAAVAAAAQRCTAASIERPRCWFGVPFTNFLGWFLCVFTLTLLFELVSTAIDVARSSTAAASADSAASASGGRSSSIDSTSAAINVAAAARARAACDASAGGSTIRRSVQAITPTPSYFTVALPVLAYFCSAIFNATHPTHPTTLRFAAVFTMGQTSLAALARLFTASHYDVAAILRAMHAAEQAQQHEQRAAAAAAAATKLKQR